MEPDPTASASTGALGETHDPQCAGLGRACRVRSGCVRPSAVRRIHLAASYRGPYGGAGFEQTFLRMPATCWEGLVAHRQSEPSSSHPSASRISVKAGKPDPSARRTSSLLIMLATTVAVRPVVTAAALRCIDSKASTTFSACTGKSRASQRLGAFVRLEVEIHRYPSRRERLILFPDHGGVGTSLPREWIAEAQTRRRTVGADQAAGVRDLLLIGPRLRRQRGHRGHAPHSGERYSPSPRRSCRGCGGEGGRGVGPAPISLSSAAIALRRSGAAPSTSRRMSTSARVRNCPMR